MKNETAKSSKAASLLLAALTVVGLTSVANAELQLSPEVKVALAGSEPKPALQAHHLGQTNADERVSVSVVVRRNNAEEFHNLVSALESGNRLAHPISREELATRYGADSADLIQVQEFAAAHGLSVDRVDQAGRLVVLSGSSAQMNQAFEVELHSYATEAGTFHSHAGQVQIPLSLSGVVQSVVGLDNVPHFRPHNRVLKSQFNDNASSGLSSFTPPQLAGLYSFPSGNGAGQCVAILELGGGYKDADLQTFFSGLGMSTPSVTAVSVDNVQNAPSGDANSADGEVDLDIEVVGALAPAAAIYVYFGDGSSDQGFLNAITAATHDSHNCKVLSISWGGPESGFSAATLQSVDQVFQEAAAAGITVTVASGDGGSKDGTKSDIVDFPSSSPHVLSCGGTTLNATADSIISETVWNLLSSNEGAGGGGVSPTFPVPSFQSGLKATTTSGSRALTGRGTPDVSGDAAPTTGYNIVVDGKNIVEGGTSAVAPLYAGLFTLINANLGTSVGFVNATLYSHPEAFHNITSGNNGTYKASKGWSAAAGLGSPIGTSIQAAF